MKKQTRSQKLILSKETLTSMAQVYGGLQLNDTVYRPAPSDNCFTATCGSCGIA